MRKYIMVSFYFLSAVLLAYLVLTSIFPDNNNRIIIGISKEVAGREIAFQGYWNDKTVIDEMVKTGAVENDLVDPGRTVWIANMKIKAKEDSIKISADDFTLEDNNGQPYKPIIDPHPQKELKRGQVFEYQLVYYIPEKNTVSTITYEVKGERYKKLIFHVGE